MRKISVAFSHKVDFQCQLFTIQIKKLLKNHYLSQEISVDWIDDENGIKLLISYPLPTPDERLSCSRSLDYFNSNFATLQHRVLPLYFGSKIDLKGFDLTGNSLVVTFRAEGVGEYLLNRICYPIEICKISGVPPVNALAISHQLDRIIGNSGLKLLYRLPSGVPVWSLIRLREVIYSIEYYQMGDNDNSPTMVRLELLQRGGVKEYDKLDRLLSGIDEYLAAEDTVDYSIAYGSKRGIYTEVRVVL